MHPPSYFMKQVIDIDSDSVQEVSHPHPPLQPIALLQEPEHHYCTEKFILTQEQPHQSWPMDARIVPCSLLLRELQSEEGQTGETQFTFQLPSSLGMESRFVSMIEEFYRRHNFSGESIRIGKVAFKSFKSLTDAISLHFCENELNRLTIQDLRILFNICQFLKFTHLKQLVGVFIASRHFFFFNENVMKEKIREYGAYFSRQEEINLQSHLKQYASELSHELLLKLKDKYDSQHGIARS